MPFKISPAELSAKYKKAAFGAAWLLRKYYLQSSCPATTPATAPTGPRSSAPPIPPPPMHLSLWVISVVAQPLSVIAASAAINNTFFMEELLVVPAKPPWKKV